MGTSCDSTEKVELFCAAGTTTALGLLEAGAAAGTGALCCSVSVRTFIAAAFSLHARSTRTAGHRVVRTAHAPQLVPCPGRKQTHVVVPTETAASVSFHTSLATSVDVP